MVNLKNLDQILISTFDVLAYEMNKFLLDSKTVLNNCRNEKPVSFGNVNL